MWLNIFIKYYVLVFVFSSLFLHHSTGYCIFSYLSSRCNFQLQLFSGNATLLCIIQNICLTAAFTWFYEINYWNLFKRNICLDQLRFIYYATYYVFCGLTFCFIFSLRRRASYVSPSYLLCLSSFIPVFYTNLIFIREIIISMIWNNSFKMSLNYK